MFTKETLLQDIAGMNINPKGTLLIHSSLKAIGPVEGERRRFWTLGASTCKMVF